MRKLKFLIFFVVIVGALIGGAGIGMRYSRDRSGPASEVKPNMAVTKHLGSIYLYGAKVGDHVILFDTGADPAGHPIDSLLTTLKAKRSDVSNIFLTHGHFDHYAGALQFPDAKIYLGAGDVGLVTGQEAPEAILAKAMTLVMATPPLARVTNPLKEKTTIDVGGGQTVMAIPVPGHTRGSFAYFYDGVLFPGDIMVFKEGRLEPTPKAFDAHPAENRDAIRGLKKLLGDVTIDRVCTPHGGCTPKGLGGNLLDDFVQRLGG